jgi:hypothetical protein
MKKAAAAVVVALVAAVIATGQMVIRSQQQLSSVRAELAAVQPCLLNDAYIGRTQEDTHHLLAQCIDDYQQRYSK